MPVDFNHDRRVPRTAKPFVPLFLAVEIVGVAVILGTAERAFRLVIESIHLPASFAGGLVDGEQELMLPRAEQHNAQVFVQNR